MIHAIKTAETVLVPIVDAYNRKINFAENLNLRGKQIIYIDTLPISAGTIDTNGNYFHQTFSFKFPAGLNSVSKTDYNGSFLVLVDGANEVINRIPVSELTRVSGFYEKFLLNRQIDIAKCYVEVPANPNRQLNTAFCFIFYTNENQPIKLNQEILSCDYEQIELTHHYSGQTMNVETPDQTAGVYIDYNKKIYFPDNESFRGRKLEYLSINPTYFSQEENFQPQNPYLKLQILSPMGTQLVLESVVRQTVITLVDKRGQLIFNQVPLWLFASASSDNGFQIKMDSLDIDFPKSNIEILGYDTRYSDVSFLFGLFFRKN